MTTTPNMSLVLPTDGGSANVWNYILDAVFGIIDGHTHLTGSGVPIVAGALNINADLTFVGNSATNLKVTSFAEQAAAAIAGYVDALWVNSVDHNLYFRNSSGVNVQITSGNTINVSVAGGIGGDYSTVNALVSYDDATRRYLLQQEGSPRPWAGLATGDIDLYQKAASIANAVKLKSPASLAASYSITLPAALPAATNPLYMSAAGVLSNATPASQTLLIPASAADINSNLRSSIGGLGMNAIQLAGGVGNYAAFPVTLPVGATVTSITVYINKSSAATTTIGGSFVQLAMASGATLILSGQNIAAAPGYTSFPISGGGTVAVAGTMYHVGVAVTSGSATTDVVLGVAVTYTPPQGP